MNQMQIHTQKELINNHLLVNTTQQHQQHPYYHVRVRLTNGGERGTGLQETDQPQIQEVTQRLVSIYVRAKNCCYFAEKGCIYIA